MRKTIPVRISIDRININAILVLLFLAVINLVILGIVIGLLANISRNTRLIPTQSAVELTVKYPAENAILSGESHATLAFPQGFGFAKLQFSVDGQLVEELTPPHPHELTFNFDTASFANGGHTLTFLAAESGGTESMAKVNITINN